MIGGIATRIGRVARLTPPRGLVLNMETDESLANSTLTPDRSINSLTLGGNVETDEDIVACFDRDYNERGDGGSSDEEGDVMNIHNDAIKANRVEQVLRNEANDLDAREEGVPSSRIPGAPGGWLPPAPPTRGLVMHQDTMHLSSLALWIIPEDGPNIVFNQCTRTRGTRVNSLPRLLRLFPPMRKESVR